MAELPNYDWVPGMLDVLKLVARERISQFHKHGNAMADLPDGTGQQVAWLAPISSADAEEVQRLFRSDYERHRGAEHDGPLGSLTKMHLVREELAEALELGGDDPEFIGEILQVAALCVQWAELKLKDQQQPEALDWPVTRDYRGYTLVGDKVGVDIWFGDEFVQTDPTEEHAKLHIDQWLWAP